MVIVEGYEECGEEFLVDIKIECDTCFCYEQYPDTLMFSVPFEREVISEMQGGTWWDWWHPVSGKILCNDCYQRLCLHPRAVDNHLCMRYAGHEGDHECCREHMFY